MLLSRTALRGTPLKPWISVGILPPKRTVQEEQFADAALSSCGLRPLLLSVRDSRTELPAFPSRKKDAVFPRDGGLEMFDQFPDTLGEYPRLRDSEDQKYALYRIIDWCKLSAATTVPIEAIHTQHLTVPLTIAQVVLCLATCSSTCLIACFIVYYSILNSTLSGVLNSTHA